MKRAVLFIVLSCALSTANAIAYYPGLNEDHVRRSKINRGFAIGTAAGGAGLLIGSATYHIVQTAFWNDQAARWEMQYQSELISKAEFDKQMSNIERERGQLNEAMRRNYWISGGLFVASIGFGLNALRHKMMISDETSLQVTPMGVRLTYSF